MELILLILKIILIAFLVIIGFIILVLGLVLLVPIHYEVSGSIGDSWEIKIRGKITYLLSIIKLLLAYENEQFDMKIFLFGFEKKLKQEDVSTIKDVGAHSIEEIEPLVEDLDTTVSEKDADMGTEPDIMVEADVKKSEESAEESEQVSTEMEPKLKKKKRTKKEESQKSIDLAFWKQQLTDEHNKSVVRKIWSEICYLLRHFKFRKIVTDLEFSTGDPATTGQALGILCMIPVLYRYQFKIVPDFEAEEFYIKGAFLVAGKVRLIHILITVLRLIFDKEVRLVVKRILTLLEK